MNEIINKLYSDEEWTPEEESNQEILGFLAMLVYKQVLSYYNQDRFLNKYSINILQKRTSKSLQTFLTKEFKKPMLDGKMSLDYLEDNDSGKALSKAMVFVSTFRDVTLGEDYDKGCVLGKVSYLKRKKEKQENV